MQTWHQVCVKDTRRQSLRAIIFFSRCTLRLVDLRSIHVFNLLVEILMKNVSERALCESL